MGYRSDVAILMYGDARDCEMVCNLFEQSAFKGESADDDRKWFSQSRQDAEHNGMHYVKWEFNDVKWYNDCDDFKITLFNLVEELVDNQVDLDPPRKYNLAIEFVRIGEEDTDVECDRSDNHDFLVTVQRALDYPDIFNK